MTRVSISALEKVLKERGISSNKILQQALQGDEVQEDISRKVAEQYSDKLGKLDERKKAGIEALADLDSRMASIFGKGGKYELTRASDVENIISNRHNTGLQQINNIQSETQDVQKQMLSDINEAVDLYQDILKENEKSSGTAKSETNKLRTSAGLDLSDKAGVYDSEAVTIFLQAPSDFQKWWLRNMVIGGSVPEGGYSLQDVQMSLKEWKRRYDTKSTSIFDSFYINQDKDSESDNPLGF